MEWMGLNEVREKFLVFFESKGHLRMPSAPLVPIDDNSLLLVNSGMAPLKKYFLGLETPPNNRVTTCQKCIRTPDIERVGKTSRHGTFFEMLGNFSFGDYFKVEATRWAWEFITEVMSIPVDRIWISIYEEDEDAARIWVEECGVDPKKIVRLGKEDNFWEIGSGPCGPCSEIYYDRGEEYTCDNPNCAVGCDCDRYVEFWNLVFTQFNSDGNGNYPLLAKPNIDTGMGLERLACIVQNVDNLFEVDTVQNIMKHIAKIAGVVYGQDEKTDVSLRVITDHIRSTVFMIGDGVSPSNEGRGYVLRRLLRRAARHGILLGINQTFLSEVCETVINENKEAYPELLENSKYIKKIISIEEERFTKTIRQGLEMLNEMVDKASTMILAGADVFRLYDTFGFPLDLTKEIAADHGIKIDEEEFLVQMKKQRDLARQAHSRKGDIGWEENVLGDKRFKDIFVGYEALSSETKIIHIVCEGELSEQISAGNSAVIFLETTPFYAESGGQVGDSGIIHVGKSIFVVNDCKKSPTGNIMHIGYVKSGFIATDDTATVMVDKKRRLNIARNHTAAHLLQAALKSVLGDHVHQAGSMVDESICRFDFTHFSAVTNSQLEDIEDKVNELILSSLPIDINEMTMPEAKKLGATALFGDKYSDIVRVVNVSGKSIELCGGTHVSNTATIGLFKILKETSIAAGVRRIEATSGSGVINYIKQQDNIINEACSALKLTAPSELPEKCISLNNQMRSTQRLLDTANEKLAAAQISESAANNISIGPVQVMASILQNAGPDVMRATADNIKDKNKDIVGILASTVNEKTTILVFAGTNAVKAGIHSGNLVREATKLYGGSGGGKPDNAMGGIPDSGNISEALAKFVGLVEAQLKK